MPNWWRGSVVVLLMLITEGWVDFELYWCAREDDVVVRCSLLSS